MRKDQGVLYRCVNCDKPLLERLPNGLWRFKFGRKNRKNERGSEFTDWAVDMFIHGSVKIRCFRDKCFHWNTFDFFPPKIEDNPLTKGGENNGESNRTVNKG